MMKLTILSMKWLLISTILIWFLQLIDGSVLKIEDEVHQELNGYGNSGFRHISEGGIPIYPWKIVKHKTTKQQEENIRKVIRHFEEITCLRFPELGVDEYKGRKDGIYISFEGSGRGCVTVWNGTPKISIGVGSCGIQYISHEIGHALGWRHEQDRSDSSKYIRFHGRIHGSFHDVDGIPYDYFSIMQYRSPYGLHGLEWKTTDRRVTYVLGALNKNKVTAGQFLTYDDVKRANFQFRCNATCNNIKITVCENEGYLSPAKFDGEQCKCNCPYGTSGPRCETGARKTYDLCGGEYEEDAIIETPGFKEGKLKENSFCSYIFKGKKDKQIQITWTKFDLGRVKPKGGCRGAYVEVRTTDYYNGQAYCSGILNDGFVQTISIGHDLAVLVNPQWDFSDRGFQAEVKYIDPPSPNVMHSLFDTVHVNSNSAPKIIQLFGEGDGMRTFKTNWPMHQVQLRIIDASVYKEGGYKIEVELSDGQIYNIYDVQMMNITSPGNEMNLRFKLGPNDFIEAEVVTMISQSGLFFTPSYATCNSSKVVLNPKKKVSFVSPNFDGLVYKGVGSNYPPNVFCEYNFETKNAAMPIYINFGLKPRGMKKNDIKIFSIDASDSLIVEFDKNGEVIQEVIKENKVYKFDAPKIRVVFKSDGQHESTGFAGMVWSN